MDLKLPPSMTSEDVAGVLRTILMFLESINFKATSTALRNECLSKGYTTTAQTSSNRAQLSVKSPETPQNKSRGVLDVEAENKEKASRRSSSNKFQSDQVLVDKHQDCQDIKKKFCQLQNEHQKLMAVTTELTSALQTHILGQSKNFNATLNSCRNIYPELFTPQKVLADDYESATQTSDASSSTRSIKTYERETQIPNFTSNSKKTTPKILEREPAIYPASKAISKSATSESANNTQSNDSLESKRPKSCDEDLAKYIPKKKSLQFDNSGRQEDEPIYKRVCHKLPEVFIVSEKRKTPRGYPMSCIEQRLFELDYKRIKHDMKKGDNEVKLALVQALRWRITQHNSATRQQVVLSYIHHDLLDLFSEPKWSNLLELYLCSDTNKNLHLFQEEMSRFLNTLASLTVGRDYLCQEDKFLLSFLIPFWYFWEVQLKPITRDMLLATFQKLSLRTQQRTLMLSAGFLEHLLTFLKTRHKELSEYCMEYSTALLMNLCLHQEAREIVALRAGDVVRLLADLLDVKYYYVMPYVNGALYSLLLNPQINDEAKKLQFDQLIMYHIENTEGEMRRQLKIILKLHKRGVGNNDCICNSNIEPDEECDILEPELDNGDPLDVKLCGEKFLENYKIGSVIEPDSCDCQVETDGNCVVPSRLFKSPEDGKIFEPTFTSEEILRNSERRSIMSCKHPEEAPLRPNEEVYSNLAKSEKFCQSRLIISFKKPEETSSQESKMENDSNLSKSEKLDMSQASSQAQLQSEQPASHHSTLSSKLLCCKPDNLSDPSQSEISDQSQVSSQIEHSVASHLTLSSIIIQSSDITPVGPNASKLADSQTTPQVRQQFKSEGQQGQPSIKTTAECSTSIPEQSEEMARPSEDSSKIEQIQCQRSLEFPMSFTRTMPMSMQKNCHVTKCENPSCSHNYFIVKSFPPIEKFSAKNPPYGCDYQNQFTTCYRESYNLSRFETDSESDGPCACCSTRVKYACNCYNVIKGSIDVISDATAASNLPNPAAVQGTCCPCEPNPPEQSKESKQRLGSLSKKSVKNIASAKFTYKELRTVVSDSNLQICSKSKVNYRSYDDVFLSRPKLLRTPP